MLSSTEISHTQGRPFSSLSFISIPLPAFPLHTSLAVVLSYEGKSFTLETEADGEKMAAEIAAAGGVTEFSLGGGKTVSLEAMRAIAAGLSSQATLKSVDFSDCFSARKEDCIFPAMDAIGHALLQAGGKLGTFDLGENAVSLEGAKIMAPHIARLTNLSTLRL